MFEGILSSKDYIKDNGLDDTKLRVAQFQTKTIVLRSNREVNKYLDSLKNKDVSYR